MVSRLLTGETERQKEVYLQVARYLLESFAVPAFRSHATVGLVDRDRIQFYHANRSVILVSSAINFSARDRTGGVEKFIAIVIAFSRLSLRDNGILHNLHDGNLFADNRKLHITKARSPFLPRGEVQVQVGNKLKFGGDENTEAFTLTYGEVISNEPSLTGRSTVVLQAESSRWEGVDLVIKISWPSSTRVAEQVFIERATKKAKSGAEHKWALDHLPQVLFAQDVTFGSDSTYEKVASLFDDPEFVGKEYKYERRTLRIIIQERLYPLKTLTNQKDLAQVLLDTACGTCSLLTCWMHDADWYLVHRWLHDHAGILHRDLGPNNIMYRKVKGKIHGVLADYDLASLRATLTLDRTKTSQQRTGTPPFMAYGLLKGNDPIHLYRHDLESLFYTILILATHYEIRAPGKEGGGMRVREEQQCFQDWFETTNYDVLATMKSGFVTELHPFQPSPSFNSFRSWLSKLRVMFHRGFTAKNAQKLLQEIKGQSDDDEESDDKEPDDKESNHKESNHKESDDEESDDEESDDEEPDNEEPDDEVTPLHYDDETLGGHVTYSAFIKTARKLSGKLRGLAIRYDPPRTPPSIGISAVQA